MPRLSPGYAAKNYEAAITRVLTKYQELHRTPRSALRDILTEDKRRNLGAHTVLRLSRSPDQAVLPRKNPLAAAKEAENKTRTDRWRRPRSRSQNLARAPAAWACRQFLLESTWTPSQTSWPRKSLWIALLQTSMLRNYFALGVIVLGYVAYILLVIRGNRGSEQRKAPLHYFSAMAIAVALTLLVGALYIS